MIRDDRDDTRNVVRRDCPPFNREMSMVLNVNFSLMYVQSMPSWDDQQTYLLDSFGDTLYGEG